MESVKVSICIPVYNMADCIERAVKSALNQTYGNIEVIVADNQSTDGTHRIVSSISDPRLTVIRNSENLGAYGNHNRCVELATGEWVKFLHGDDELLSECVEDMVNVLEKCPESIGIVGCGAIVIEEGEREIERTLIPKGTIVMRPAAAREFFLYGHVFGTPTMTMLHRDRLLEAGGFDLAIDPAADGDCWINLRTRYASVVIPRYLVILRDDPAEPMKSRGRQVVKYYEPVIKSIDKWHKLDPEMKDIPLAKTPYGDRLRLDTFRYWNTAFYHMVCGRTAVLTALISSLARRGILLQSLGTYILKILQGRGTYSLQDKTWIEGLSHLTIAGGDEPN